MKIVVVLNKHGEQINLSLPNNWDKKDIFETGDCYVCGNLTDKFVDYFEKHTGKSTYDNKFYFDHVFYVDISKDLANYQSHKYDEYDLNDIHEKIHFVDYPYIGIGEKPWKKKVFCTEEDIEKIIGG